MQKTSRQWLEETAPTNVEVAKIVREKHITLVVFGRSALTGWRRFLYLSVIHKFLRDAPAVDVQIVTKEPK